LTLLLFLDHLQDVLKAKKAILICLSLAMLKMDHLQDVLKAKKAILICLSLAMLKMMRYSCSLRKQKKKREKKINYILWIMPLLKERAKKHHLLNEITKNPITMLVGDENELRRIIGQDVGKN